MTRLYYDGEISYQYARRRLLRQIRHGEVPREEACDADRLLITAAQFHGWAAGCCPVCGEDSLRHMRWVHGDRLGTRSGTARSDAEIVRIVTRCGPVTVHDVEVCTRCRWNHVLSSRTALGVVPEEEGREADAAEAASGAAPRRGDCSAPPARDRLHR